MTDTIFEQSYKIDKKARQLDELLNDMAAKIQLDNTRYEKMRVSYEAVKSWLEADEVFFKQVIFDIYPHGSVRVLTTVRPIKKDEFDLDIALHIYVNSEKYTSTEIYNHLKRRLEEHDTYKKMLELKKRCLRLNYSGDFHMDIMPGVHDPSPSGTKIKVPDRGLGYWVSSDPKGYSSWFLGRANEVKESLLEKALKAEKLPIDNFKYKKPLQRAVQLIKQYKNIYFQNDDTYKTSSIILTTISGHCYRGEETIFETIDNIISSVLKNIKHSSHLTFSVLNPVNPEEDFTDKWKKEPKYYTHFIDFCNHLHNEWQLLKKDNGVVTESKVLKGLFGEKLFLESHLSQLFLLEQARKNNNLFIDSKNGNLTNNEETQNKKVYKNTFYGGVDNNIRIKSSLVTKKEQINSFRQNYPDFLLSYTGENEYKVTGCLQPTPRSKIYEFELIHKLGKKTKIKIKKPTLDKVNSWKTLPHVYRGDFLCLFHPLKNEFLEEDYVAEKIIPWISLWLYHYEQWLITGLWLGGGEHPPKNSDK